MNFLVRVWRHLRQQPCHRSINAAQANNFPCYLYHNRIQHLRTASRPYMLGRCTFSHPFPFLSVHSQLLFLGKKSYNSYSYRRLESSSPFPAPLLGAGLLLFGHSDQDDKELNFLTAIKEGNLRAVKLLLKNGVDVNSRHSLGWNALHVAVINGHLDIIKLLVENGADINVKDEFSSAQRMAYQERTSPMIVAHIRDSDFCSYIDHYVSYSGFTPLHYALLLDDPEVVKVLLEHGADPTLENNRGCIPSDYATNDRIKLLLENSIAEHKQRKRKEKLEERRRFPLEKRLKEHIVGQEGPIAAVAAAIRRREMGWADEEHPMVFLFLGSSGIGKTELAKQIAKHIHHDKPEGFIRIDMTEYQEKHEVAKLIGAPPGYIGHDQGGQLTSRLCKCPDAVVLFDEVEKAHPDILTVMLQLFDEGRLTDGQGKTVECKNAMFVMTSNLASEVIASHGLQLRREAQRAAEKYRDVKEDPQKHIEISREFKDNVVEPILKRHFKRDEFLGRINEMLYFLPFSRLELNLLVEKELVAWKERAKRNHSIELSWEREALDVLADGYNVRYGARSIKHEIERVVVTKLADAFEQEALSPGDKVLLAVEPGSKDGTAMVCLKIESSQSQPLEDRAVELLGF